MHILYDLEIVKAIPDKSLRLPEIDYCEGWGDHAGMGVSVIGYCEVEPIKDGIEFSTPIYKVGDEYGLRSFQRIAQAADGLIGFNSRNFDDSVMQAQGFPVRTTYDLLDEVRLAAYGSTSYKDAPHGHSYKLSRLGDANGLTKTGDGANAAIEWQQGLHKKVIDYCLNDVAMTAALLRLGLVGKLVDPNTGKLLKLRLIS